MKRCSRCGQEKPLDAFYPSHRARNKAAWCRPCHTAYNRERGHAQPGYWAGFKRVTVQRKRLALSKLKAETGCADCGERDPIVLEFHHSDPATKTGTVSQMGVLGASLDKILAEARKCVVLCANCHRRRHHREIDPSVGSFGEISKRLPGQ